MVFFPEHWLIIAVIPEQGMSYRFCFSAGKAETELCRDFKDHDCLSSGHMCLSGGNEKQTREFLAACLM